MTYSQEKGNNCIKKLQKLTTSIHQLYYSQTYTALPYGVGVGMDGIGVQVSVPLHRRDVPVHTHLGLVRSVARGHFLQRKF